MSKQIINLVGKKFGRLIVIKFDKKINSNYYWLCKCICGNKKSIISASFKSGKTTSCGCYLQEKRLEPKKHGMSGNRFYNIYNGLKYRCTKNYPYSRYKDYGGRGIKCLWKSFENFKNDMYKSYKYFSKKYGEKNISIERINVNGNYCKKNTKWILLKDQSLNTRRTIKIKFKNKELNLHQWSIITGISANTLSRRIFKYKYSIKDTLTKPVFQKYKYKNKLYSLKELSKKYKIGYDTLHNRVHNLKYDIEYAIEKK